MNFMEPPCAPQPMSQMPPPHGRHRLSAREAQVVRLLSLGCSVPEAAAILSLAHSTVGNHKNRAMQKLRISKASLLTRAAIKFGISTLNDELNPTELLRLARARLVQKHRSKPVIRKSHPAH